uniref:Uncharacterized protein n=1 Tax=Manihot esculenta TaxID=3983 RepID=A0A2C9V9M6_MANES
MQLTNQYLISNMIYEVLSKFSASVPSYIHQHLWLFTMFDLFFTSNPPIRLASSMAATSPSCLLSNNTKGAHFIFTWCTAKGLK